MSQYHFRFQGTVLQGFQPNKVIADLALLFDVSTADLQTIFKGTHQFVRRDLDLETARAYQQLFSQYGAKGDILEADKADVAQQNEQQNIEAERIRIARLRTSSSCPKCASKNLHDGQCADCGIVIEKYVNRLLAALDTATTEPDSLTQEVLDTQKQRKKAAAWLGAAAAIMLLLSTVDEYFQSHIAFTLGYVDFGIWPYILAHGVMLRGCFCYARSKGYDPEYGLFGLLSYAGLAILFWLPDKNSNSNTISTTQKLLAAGCIGICIYWLFNAIHTGADFERISDESAQLASGRHEYPSGLLDSDEESYAREWNELENYLKNTLAVLQSDDIRTGQAEKISARMLDDLARYRIWKNYQTFLHITQNQPLPPALTYEQKKQENKLLAAILAGGNKDQTTPFALTMQEWTSGFNPFHPDNRFWDNVHTYLMDIYKQYNNYQLIKLDKRNQESGMIQLTLSDFQIAPNNKIDTQKGDYTITYSAKSGPLQKAPLTMAYYVEIYDRAGKTYFNRHADVISYQLPSRYVQSPFNVLSDIYGEIHMMR